MSSQLPDRLDRATFERVLQRAAELQAQRQDVGETLSEAEVLALGKDVGISESHLRQALVESRLHVEVAPADGAMDRALGPGEISVERVVQGSQESIGEALTEWFEREEILAVQRSTPGRIAWEPLTAFAGAMRKIRVAFEHGRGPAFLNHAHLVQAVISPLEEGYCHVTLIASLGKARSSYVIGGSAIGFGGLTVGVLAMIIGAPAFVLAATALPAMGGGWLVARMFRPIADRARVGLLRALDRLERQPALLRGTTTPTALPKPSGLAVDIGSAVRDIATEIRKAIDEGKGRR